MPHLMGVVMRFSDRIHAGRLLAGLLEQQELPADTVVLGLPRGGVPVAYEVATALDLPLDVIVVRKLGVPFQPELAMGAIGEDEVRILNEQVVRSTSVGSEEIDMVEKRERIELLRRIALFRGDRPRTPLTGRSALIIDDGIATGSTALVACEVARAHGARQVVVATPVAPPDTVAKLQGAADDVYCVSTPTHFWAIGEFYIDFTQTSDEEVAQLLATAAARPLAEPVARDDRDTHPGPAAQAGRPADSIERDPYMEHAREEAEGIDVFGDPAPGGFLERAREEAQGIEVFADPDATLPAAALREGTPGEETFTADNLELGPDGEEERDR